MYSFLNSVGNLYPSLLSTAHKKLYFMITYPKLAWFSLFTVDIKVCPSSYSSIQDMITMLELTDFKPHAWKLLNTIHASTSKLSPLSHLSLSFRCKFFLQLSVSLTLRIFFPFFFFLMCVCVTKNKNERFFKGL